MKMLFKVKVFPCQNKSEVIRKSEDAFDVKVKSKPERGLANEETAALLADYLKIPRPKIRLIRGFKQRNKIFEVLA